MKVAQILFSGLGGHGGVVIPLIDADTGKQWEHQLLFYGIEDLLPAYKDFCKQKNIPYLFVLKRKGFLHPHFLSVYRALKKLRPQVIILHSPTVTLQAKMYCFFNRAKLVVVEHTSNNAKTKGEWLGTFFALTLARKIVYLTEKYQQEIKEKISWFDIKKRSVIIPNGIDLNKFVPSVRPKTGKLQLGMAGRFFPTKCQLFLVKTLIDLIKNGAVQKNIVLQLAGNGERYDMVKQEIENSGLNENFVLHGLLNQEELINFFGQLDVYIHASYAETMCTAVMQAMSCGLPVLASNISGINNLVQDGESGFLFNNDDVEGISKCLQLLEQEEKRNSMGAKARQYAVENFSSTTTFNKYNNLITNL